MQLTWSTNHKLAQLLTVDERGNRKSRTTSGLNGREAKGRGRQRKGNVTIENLKPSCTAVAELWELRHQGLPSRHQMATLIQIKGAEMNI